jgi:hypothetical protein
MNYLRSPPSLKEVQVGWRLFTAHLDSLYLIFPLLALIYFVPKTDSSQSAESGCISKYFYFKKFKKPIIKCGIPPSHFQTLLYWKVMTTDQRRERQGTYPNAATDRLEEDSFPQTDMNSDESFFWKIFRIVCLSFLSVLSVEKVTDVCFGKYFWITNWPLFYLAVSPIWHLKSGKLEEMKFNF